MIEGNLSVGDPVELMPSGQRAKVRTLQVHNHSVEQAYAGQRVAVNLAGLRRDAVAVAIPSASPIPCACPGCWTCA